jgi:mannitol operon repressor
LRDILKAFFLENLEAEKLIEGFNAPLGTFSSRAVAAYCCGLLLELEHRELTILRKIRNAFAHSKTAKFTDQKISDLCNNLEMCVPDKPGKPPLGASAKFSSSATLLIIRLVNRAHYVPRQAAPKSWPL